MTDSAIAKWKHLGKEMESELFGGIIPFWETVAPDYKDGGFHGFIDNSNAAMPKSPKGLVMHARLLWAFAAIRAWRDEERFEIGASRAMEYLRNTMADPIHGGYWWQTDSSGNPTDRNKVVYGQAFALYGFSEYLRRKEDRDVHNRASALFELMEKYARDTEGGYLEILAEDWSSHPEGRLSDADIPCRKSMNTNLHVLEAYTNYCRVRPDEAVSEALKSLVLWFTGNIYDADRKHLNLFLNEDGRSMKDVDSYGHDIEAAWLIREAVEVLGDKALEKKVLLPLMNLAETALAEGISPIDGAMEYEREGAHRDSDRHWWVQAEAIVGFRDQWEITREERWADAAVELWSFLKKSIIDRENGEWRWGVHADGTPMDKEKAGLWKTPYHNSRACLEILWRIRQDKTPE